MHHAFTAPKPEWEDRIESDTGSVLADAYDIVCNGHEIGGGSVRIHRRDIQERVFAVMGLDKAEAEEKFGFLLEAFMFGAPPHGESRSGGTGPPRCWPGWTRSVR